MLDFEGVTADELRQLLAGDDSRDAKQLLAKLRKDEQVDEMMLVLADCLVEHVKESLSDDVIRENIRAYSES
jgi:hypothetical protein